MQIENRDCWRSGVGRRGGEGNLKWTVCRKAQSSVDPHVCVPIHINDIHISLPAFKSQTISDRQYYCAMHVSCNQPVSLAKTNCEQTLYIPSLVVAVIIKYRPNALSNRSECANTDPLCLVHLRLTPLVSCGTHPLSPKFICSFFVNHSATI